MSIATTPLYGQAFIDHYNGQAVDTDGFPPAQPYQCYDLWIIQKMVNFSDPRAVILSPSGLAQDIWKNFDGLGLAQWYDKVSSPQLGDWVIWDRVKLSTPDSHVAMFVKDNGDGTIQTFGQNAPYPRCTISNVTKQGILGYIRIKGGAIVEVTKRVMDSNQLRYMGRMPIQGEYDGMIGKVSYADYMAWLENHPESIAWNNTCNLGRRAQAENWEGQLASGGGKFIETKVYIPVTPKEG